MHNYKAFHGIKQHYLAEHHPDRNKVQGAHPYYLHTVPSLKGRIIQAPIMNCLEIIEHLMPEQSAGLVLLK